MQSLNCHYHQSIHTVCVSVCVCVCVRTCVRAFFSFTSSLPLCLFFREGYLRFLWSKHSIFVTFNTGLPLKDLPSIQKLKRLAHILSVIQLSLSSYPLLVSTHLTLSVCFCFTIPSYSYSTFSIIPSVSSSLFMPTVYLFFIVSGYVALSVN